MIKVVLAVAALCASFAIFASFSHTTDGLTSEVTFETREEGASIKYMPVARDDTKTAHGLTNGASATMPIGVYYIWAERGGSRSSEKQEHRIVRKAEHIVVVEY